MRYQKISLGLGGVQEEEYSPISRDWSYDGREMEFEEGLVG